MAISLFLMLAPPGELVPRGHSGAIVVARARIVSGVRINFQENAEIPPGAQKRGGLIEFE